MCFSFSKCKLVQQTNSLNNFFKQLRTYGFKLSTRQFSICESITNPQPFYILTELYIATVALSDLNNAW